MRLQPVRIAVTLFSGFLQRNHSEASGLLVVDNYIRQVCNGRADVRVTLCPWNANESDVAESLWRLRPRDELQLHLVIGYSYGGDRAVKFCREIQERGDSDIRGLVLIDPVVRWDWIPGVAAMGGLGVHEVPDQVSSVTVFAQRNRRWSWRTGRWLFEPRAHPVWHRGRTLPPVVLGVSHSYIDNAQAVRDVCVEAAKRLVA